MRKVSPKRLRTLFATGAVLVCTGIGLQWTRDLRPVRASGNDSYYRLNSQVKLSQVLETLEEKDFLRSAKATMILARLMHSRSVVSVGTYQFGPEMTAAQILKALKAPIRRMFRIPETNWAARTARLLQKNEACSARSYLDLVHNPQLAQSLTSVPLPQTSLEGYLYPDTYDIPPILGARRIVQMQLDDFDNRVYKVIGPIPNLQQVLTIASLIQLEAGNKSDEPLISAVIANRIKKGMPLQIDASLLYGLGVWRRLTFKDYRSISGPYNLYTHKGLPPTPICSPTIDAIEAALHPAQVNYLYYVALPNGHTLFASSYKQHLKNIAIRKQVLAQTPTGNPNQ